MKKNDLIQIKGSDTKELRLKLRTLKGEVADLVLDKNMKKLKDLKKIGKKKKDLAQILTVLRQKELLQELEPKLVGAKTGKDVEATKVDELTVVSKVRSTSKRGAK
ncbi:50S ribosomal protein L29 [Candidatus Daviesbacteria bacterium]|nr:50S ribosomal protein L29 [Candidatus Daviesbacteria bacterium]